MAKAKNKKTLRDVPTPFISRSYDPYSLEKRIYNLEQGGGVSPTPTTNLITFDKTITTSNSGWWPVTDEEGNVLNSDTDIVLDITFIHTNEAEGETAYLSCEWYIYNDNKYYLRFITMRDQSIPQNSSQTHKVRVTYMKKEV